MSQSQNHGRRNGLYSRTEDDDIYFHVGKFSFLTAEEIATLANRNPVSLRKRLRQLTQAGFLARDEAVSQREQFFEEIVCTHCNKLNRIPRNTGHVKPKPYFHWLTRKGGEKAAPLLPNPIIWNSKKPSRIDHDRVITMIHLALDRAYGDKLQGWLQQKDDVKLTVEIEGQKVNFYADGFCTLEDRPLWLEYANSAPSSKDGVNDIVKKVIRYNEILKGVDGKVIFVFREREMVENFVNRIAQEYPFLWVYATDLESILHNPTGNIFFTPKDFADRAYSLLE